MSEPFVGEIRLLSFSRAPQGWFACDGRLLPISQYDALFSLIGTYYGGDGRTTFALPDLRGRVPMNYGNGPGLPPYRIGENPGEEHVTLISSQLPSHNHRFSAVNQTADSNTPGSGVQLGALASDSMYVTDLSGVPDAQTNPASIDKSGGSQAHDNLMPTLSLSFCMAYEGLYPSRN